LTCLNMVQNVNVQNRLKSNAQGVLENGRVVGSVGTDIELQLTQVPLRR
jgi:hypothetical protein